MTAKKAPARGGDSSGTGTTSIGVIGTDSSELSSTVPEGRPLHIAMAGELEAAEAEDRPALALCGVREPVVTRYRMTAPPEGGTVCAACLAIRVRSMQ